MTCAHSLQAQVASSWGAAKPPAKLTLDLTGRVGVLAAQHAAQLRPQPHRKQRGVLQHHGAAAGRVGRCNVRWA